MASNNKSNCNYLSDLSDDDSVEPKNRKENPKWKFPKKRQFLQNNDSIYNYRGWDLSGQNEIHFELYRNNIFLVVNVASFCNYTYQYLELNDLQTKYKRFGFKVFGFPCNQFAHQEPCDTRNEILNCLRYVRPGNDFRPNFHLFRKCDVNGENEKDLFTFLKSSCPPPIEEFSSTTNLIYKPLRSSDIRWNFEKFLLNRDGKVVMRFHHETTPREIEPFIDVLLNDGSLNDLAAVASQLTNPRN